MNENWLRDHFFYFVAPKVCDLFFLKYASVHEIKHPPGKDTYEAAKEIIKKTKLRPGMSKCFALTKNAANLIYSSIRKLDNISKRRRIVFSGRDGWLFYVAARKREMNCIFIPELSRMSASSIWSELVKKHNLTNDDFYFDTGFVGSIYRGKVEAQNTALCSVDIKSYSPGFLKESREMITRDVVINEIEETPKYFTSADYDGRQYVNQHLEEFIAAWKLTEMVWKGKYVN